MRKRLSNMLLSGAMIAALYSVAYGATPTYGNGSTEIAITYNAARSNGITGSNFWMQGGGVQVAAEFYRGLGVVADVAVVQTGNINSSGVGLTLATENFGPRYTLRSGRYAFYGQALGGIANGLNSVFPNPLGAATSSQNSFAMEVGGGTTLALTPHIALRPFEADWLRTELPNSTTNVQNNLRLAGGFVFRFR